MAKLLGGVAPAAASFYLARLAGVASSLLAAVHTHIHESKREKRRAEKP